MLFGAAQRGLFGQQGAQAPGGAGGARSTAERLRVPLHFHPQTPVQAVQDAYYSGLPSGVGRVLATAGVGW